MERKIFVIFSMLILLSSCSDKTFDGHSMSDDEVSGVIDRINDNAKVFENVD